jgi:phosphoribosylaminoimidazole-succinocarboxamide synthase
MIARTSQIYIDAYQAITGEVFRPDLSGATPLDRIRINLAPFFQSA